MIEYVRNTDAPHYLLLTECTMGDNIIAENPRKEIVRLCSVRCPFMNEITLEDTLSALEKNQHVVEIPATAVDARFRTLFRQTMEQVGSATASPRVPSHSECRFCDISRQDCAQKIEVPPPGIESEHNLFS